MVKDVAFVAYSVRNVPAAVEFYRDTMGLKLVQSFGDFWHEFEVGAVTFGIGNGEPLGIAPGSSFAITFEVDDVQSERARLIERGVAVTDVNDAPGCWSAFVTDPEGNRFGIHQRKPAAT